MQRLLRASELSAITGVPTSTLFHMAKADRIPHVRLGRSVRFPEQDIERWLAARSRGGEEQRGASGDEAA
ncbi:MAG: helix-turn-helix transcriptional regulator [Anaerolineae bacterium]